MSIPKPQGMEFRHGTFLAAGDSTPTWNWLEIGGATKIIRLRATVNLEVDGDLGFIASDGASSVNFSSTSVLQRFAVTTWGNGGVFQSDINDWQAISAGNGVPLHDRTGTRRVKRNNWSSWEINLSKFGTNTMMHWTGQYQGETDGELVVYGLCVLSFPIATFKKLGFKGSQRITNQSIAINYK